MGVIISLLRGVNVGGHNMIKMDSLRKLYESLGLHDPQTYVQSGNVVFKTSEENLVQLSKRIEDGIERSFGFRPGVMVRTAPELAGVIARNPFATRKDIHPSKLLIIFLANDLDPKAQDEILRIKAGAEEVRVDGREIYIYFPDGMGRSKLPALLEKTLKKAGTGRNWNSVTKLLEIARNLE
jgi:uncharacterized protein (DUF1697 family)